MSLKKTSINHRRLYSSAMVAALRSGLLVINSMAGARIAFDLTYDDLQRIAEYKTCALFEKAQGKPNIFSDRKYSAN